MATHYQQALIHIDRRQWNEALQCLTLHLTTAPFDAPTLFSMGAVYTELGHYGIAAALLKQALSAKPDDPDSLNALAVCFRKMNQREIAEGIFRYALEKTTDRNSRTRLYTNYGGLFINEGEPEKALSIFEEGAKLDPDAVCLLYNRGLPHLEMGHWKEGWEGWEYRFQEGCAAMRSYGGRPMWKPSETYARVIAWGDQGVGDEIQFASCLPDLIAAAKGGVIFDCHPRLVDLFKRSFPEIEVYGTRKILSELPWLADSRATHHVPLASLPSMFRNRDEDFPGKPFLKADRPQTPKSANLRVGISWAGGSPNTNQHYRTIPLEKWLPILQTPGVDFFSLQYTDAAPKEICELEERSGVHIRHYPGLVQCENYDRTCSFIAGLDLVITVCTTAHHAANAIGVPTWTLVPSKPSWKYAAGGELWYRSTARFFRQKGTDWDTVISDTARALAHHRDVSRAEQKAA